MFRVLKDIADNECESGSLPIHVRLWADEYYSGPKPSASEELLGEIRSRNISMVPILQDISQLQTLFPQNKWSVFTSNCAITVYLGSGPTAFDTHKWISDMLGETTIDVRSDSVSQGKNGGGSLQNSKAAMKLLKPEQVREMPNKDCIILVEGEKPLYDRKNRPFHTEIWKEAQKAAGKNGYRHPVRVLHDKEKDIYKTVQCEEKILMIDKEEEQFYRNAAKTDKSIHIFDLGEEEFLYLNWDEQKPASLEELQNLVRDSKKNDVSHLDPPLDVMTNSEIKDEERPEVPVNKAHWDLSGTILDCFKKYAEQMPEKEIDLILQCMEEGIPEWQIKTVFRQNSIKEMERLHRIFSSLNKG